MSFIGTAMCGKGPPTVKYEEVFGATRTAYLRQELFQNLFNKGEPSHELHR